MSAKIRYLKLVARGPYYKKNYTLKKEHTTPEFLNQFMREATALIEEGLARDGLVRLHEFGTFELQWAKERRGRNPSTGEAIIIPGKNRVVFRPANKLETLANREFAHLKPAPIVPEPKPIPVAEQPKPAPEVPSSRLRFGEILSDFVPTITPPQPARLRFDFAESEADEADLTELAEPSLVVGNFETEPVADEDAWNELLSTPTKPAQSSAPESRQQEKHPEPSASQHEIPMSTAPLLAPRPEPAAARRERETARVYENGQFPSTVVTSRRQRPEVITGRERSYSGRPGNGFSRDAQPSGNGSRRFLWFAGTMAALLLLLLAFLAIWPRLGQKSTNSTSTEMAAVTAPPQPPISEPTSPAKPQPFFAGGSHQVGQGDNLWRISRQYYIDPFLWPNIYRENVETIDNPDVLEMAQTLALPVLHGHPGKLTLEDRRNLAHGYFLVFDYYKNNSERHLAPFALWAAVKYDPAILETHRDQISADELAFLQAHESGRMAVR